MWGHIKYPCELGMAWLYGWQLELRLRQERIEIYGIYNINDKLKELKTS